MPLADVCDDGLQDSTALQLDNNIQRQTNHVLVHCPTGRGYGNLCLCNSSAGVLYNLNGKNRSERRKNARKDCK